MQMCFLTRLAYCQEETLGKGFAEDLEIDICGWFLYDDIISYTGQLGGCKYVFGNKNSEIQKTFTKSHSLDVITICIALKLREFTNVSGDKLL